jgi:hypothetical protein
MRLLEKAKKLGKQSDRPAPSPEAPATTEEISGCEHASDAPGVDSVGAVEPNSAPEGSPTPRDQGAPRPVPGSACLAGGGAEVARWQGAMCEFFL